MLHAGRPVHLWIIGYFIGARLAPGRLRGLPLDTSEECWWNRDYWCSPRSWLRTAYIVKMGTGCISDTNYWCSPRFWPRTGVCHWDVSGCKTLVEPRLVLASLVYIVEMGTGCIRGRSLCRVPGICIYLLVSLLSAACEEESALVVFGLALAYAAPVMPAATAALQYQHPVAAWP